MRLIKKGLKELGLFRLKDRRSRSRITILLKYILHSGVREEGEVLPHKRTFWGLAGLSVWTREQMRQNSAK